MIFQPNRLFVIIAVIVQISPLTANFSDFLTSHHNHVNALHLRFTSDLVMLRQQLATALLKDTGSTLEIFGDAFQGLSTQKLETMNRFDGVTNSTCIQNLKNLVLNTHSLSGFRIDGCLSLLSTNASYQSDHIYKLINTHQLRVNKFLLAFVEESMGENTLIDEEIVMEKITARYWDERNNYDVTFINSVNNGDFNLTNDIQSLNRELQECMVDVVQNFKAVALLAEVRITTICDQA